jgi:hypothetical protein
LNGAQDVSDSSGVTERRTSGRTGNAGTASAAAQHEHTHDQEERHDTGVRYCYDVGSWAEGVQPRRAADKSAIPADLLWKACVRTDCPVCFEDMQFERPSLLEKCSCVVAHVVHTRCRGDPKNGCCECRMPAKRDVQTTAWHDMAGSRYAQCATTETLRMIDVQVVNGA